MNISSFLTEITNQIRPLTIATNLAYWELNTANSPTAKQNYLNAKKKLLKLYTNSNIFTDIKRFHQSNITVPLEKRQIDLLYYSFLMNQIPHELMGQIIILENEIENRFINFRIPFSNTSITNNDLLNILTHTTNNSEAHQVWEASKQIGIEVAPLVIKLVELRNKAAHNLGFSNYFELSLICNELNPVNLMNMIHQLAELTDEPFSRLKSKLDSKLAAKFNINVNELKPWHYGDPFFQAVPPSQTFNLESYFLTDLVQIATRYYQEIGLNPLPILKKSDLYERPGKSQQAFSTDIDQNGDIRILCNLRPNKYWMSTLMHELGHGIYDLYYDPDLPYLLKVPAHILTTEAIALLMGRLTEEPEWLQEYLAIPGTELYKYQTLLKNESQKGLLIFIRWCLVMVNFEYHLYQNPYQDLNTLWWDLVEKFQKLTRPTNRYLPDWAAKIHLGVAPVYYQNYLLGECAAAQILNYIHQNISKNHSLLKDKSIGNYLIAKIFSPGANFHWSQLIKLATGEDLTPNSLHAEFNLNL